MMDMYGDWMNLYWCDLHASSEVGKWEAVKSVFESCQICLGWRLWQKRLRNLNQIFDATACIPLLVGVWVGCVGAFVNTFKQEHTPIFLHYMMTHPKPYGRLHSPDMFKRIQCKYATWTRSSFVMLLAYPGQMVHSLRIRSSVWWYVSGSGVIIWVVTDPLLTTGSL